MKPRLKIYLTSIYIAFFSSLIFSWNGFDYKQALTMFGFILLLFIFNLEVVTDLQANLAYMITFPFVIPAFVYLEPFYAVLFVGVGTFVITHKFVWYKKLFNTSVYGLSIYASSYLFHLFYPSITDGSQFYTPYFFMAIIVLILVNKLINSGLLFLVISLEKGTFDLNAFIGLLTSTKSAVLTSFLGVINILLFFYTNFIGVAIATFIGFFVKPAFQYRHIFDNDLSTYTKFVLHILKSMDPITYEHSERVKFWTVKIAESMGLTRTEVRQLSQAASWHDIGKIETPIEILNKPGKLTEEEYETIKRHPEAGYNLVKEMPFFERFLSVIRHHHERYDGTGYPEGKKGEETPLHARIMAVADAFDAMTSNRSYRKGMEVTHAVKELRKNAGKQFDPIVVEVLILYLQEEFGQNYEKFAESFPENVV